MIILESFKVSSICYIKEDGRIVKSKILGDLFNDKSIQYCQSEDYYRVVDFLESLYLYKDNETLYISKSIKSFFLYCEKKPIISTDASELFLDTGFVFAPWTIYENVFLMCPGYRFVYNNCNFSIEPDWLVIGQDSFSLTTYKNILTNALRKSLIKSSGACFTLSGGVDSSILSYIGKEVVGYNGYTLTAEMDGFKKELGLAKIVSRQLRWENIIYRYSAINNRYQNIIDNFIEETFLPVSDAMVPVVYEMLSSNLKNKDHIIVEGQGADSSCFGLPHNWLLSNYKENLYFIYRILYYLLPSFQTKSNAFSRNIYRVKKSLYCLSQKNISQSYLSSFTRINCENPFFRKIMCYFEHCFENYESIHHAIAHILLYLVLPSREMYKYTLPQKEGMKFSLPFLDRDLIEYSFMTSIENYFSEGNRKKPIYDMGEDFFPGLFTKNRTSPYYINYDLPSKTSNNKKSLIQQLKSKHLRDSEMHIKYDYALNKLEELIESY